MPILFVELEVDPNEPEFESQYAGKTFHLCSKECKAKFDQQPEHYSNSAA
jgi:YHS domain-containing protein